MNEKNIMESDLRALTKEELYDKTTQVNRALLKQNNKRRTLKLAVACEVALTIGLSVFSMFIPSIALSYIPWGLGCASVLACGKTLVLLGRSESKKDELENIKEKINEQMEIKHQEEEGIFEPTAV